MMMPSVSTEADRVEEELATLAAHVDAATHRLLVLVRRYDELGAWAHAGARSCAHWLTWRIGLAPGAAREKVRVAHALAALPRIDDALRLGKLSYAKVRAMTRVATAENEGILLEMALHSTAAQLEKICRGVRRVATIDRERAHADRAVTTRQLDSGLVRITIDLHADEAALVPQAIEAARRVSDGDAPALSEPADAAVAVAEGFLAGGRSDVRSGPERHTVVVQLGPDALEHGYRAELDDGTTVPAETFRRVACDCAFSAVVTDASGSTTPSGRRTRVVSAPLRRALALRDPCCRFPGCTNRRWLDAHHVQHWIHGGDTTLDNLAHLCPFHHKLVHEGGFTVVEEAGVLVFRNPVGRVVEPAPTPRALGPSPIATLFDSHADLAIHAETNLPHWDGRHPDYRSCVEAALPSE